MNSALFESCAFLNFGKLSKDEVLKLDRRKDRGDRFLVVDRASGVCDVFEGAMFQKRSQHQQNSEGYILVKVRGRKDVRYDIASGTVWTPESGSRKAHIFDPARGAAETLLRNESLRGILERKITRLPENLQIRAIRRIEQLIEFAESSKVSTKENLILLREHYLSQLLPRQLRELDEWLRVEMSASQPMAA